jgi:hypothetical protein
MVTGSLPIPLKRNMTVIRLGDGSLLLHSVVAMNDEGMAKLDALGKPSVLIVPHGGQRMDAAFYEARHPQARVVCPAATRAQVEQVVKVDATCEEALPAMARCATTAPRPCERPLRPSEPRYHPSAALTIWRASARMASRCAALFMLSA